MFSVSLFKVEFCCEGAYFVSELLEQDKHFVSHDALEISEEEQNSASKFLTPKSLQTKRLSIITETTIVSENSVEVELDKGEITIDTNFVFCATTDTASTSDFKEETENFKQKSNSYDNVPRSIVASDSILDDEKSDNVDLFWDEKLAIRGKKMDITDEPSKSSIEMYSHASEPQLNMMGGLSSIGDTSDYLKNGQRIEGMVKSNGSCDDLPTLGNGCSDQRKPLYSSKSHENIGSKKLLDGLRKPRLPLAKQLSERSIKGVYLNKKFDSLDSRHQSLFNTTDDNNDSDDEIRQSDASRSSSTTSFSTIGSGYSRVYKKVLLIFSTRLYSMQNS